MKMYFAGPGDYDLNRGLPPGTDCFQCELAPSGHMVIPCCEYGNETGQHGSGELTLVTQQRTETSPGSSSSVAGPPGLSKLPCSYQ